MSATNSGQTLTRKVALVTGASAGIGLAAAKALSAHGARVVITELPDRLEAADQAAAEFAGGALPLDLRDLVAIRRTVQEVVAREGRLDILVNNAGVAIRKPALELTPEDWDAVLDVNLRGAFFMAQAAGRVMVAQRSGRVINVASIFGLVGALDRAAYASSKGALVNLTRCLALEWAPFNVQVNAVAPSFALTPLTERLFADPAALDAVLAQTPAGRLAALEEVGEAIAFLASSVAAFITGATLPVDGGWTAR
jgi:2-dehydro-3-deoxy-D-gluconate 5-dehydrogenase